MSMRRSVDQTAADGLVRARGAPTELDNDLDDENTTTSDATSLHTSDDDEGNDEGSPNAQETAFQVDGNDTILAALTDEGISLVDNEMDARVDFLACLPYEVAIYTILFADVATLCRARAVSRIWRDICTDNVVWRDHFHRQKGWRVRPELLEAQSAAEKRHSTMASSPPATTRNDRTPPESPSVNIAKRFSRRLSNLLPDLGGLHLSSVAPTLPLENKPSVLSEFDSSLPATRPRADTTSTSRSIVSSGYRTFRGFCQSSLPFEQTDHSAAVSSLQSESERFRTPFAFASTDSTHHNRPQFTSMGRRSSSFLSPFGPILSPFHRGEPEAPLNGLDWFELYKTRYLLDRRWRAARQKPKVLSGHLDSVYCIQADRTKLISGGRDHTVHVWDLKSGKSRKSFVAHDASVLCLQYDARNLITGSSDTTIKVWNIRTYKLERTLKGHHMGVLDCRMDDDYIVSCSKDHSIRVWLRDSDVVFRTMTGHRGPVNAIRIQKERIISASGDCLMKLWDIPSGEVIRVFAGHARGLACVEWSGDRIASGSNDHQIRIWNVNTGVCLAILKGHTDLVRSLSFDSDSNRLASAGYDKTVRLWDPESGEQLIEFRKGHSSLVLAVEMDVSRLISCSHDKRIVVLDFGRHLDVSPFI